MFGRKAPPSLSERWVAYGRQSVDNVVTTLGKPLLTYLAVGVPLVAYLFYVQRKRDRGSGPARRPGPGPRKKSKKSKGKDHQTVVGSGSLPPKPAQRANAKPEQSGAGQPVAGSGGLKGSGQPTVNGVHKTLELPLAERTHLAKRTETEVDDMIPEAERETFERVIRVPGQEGPRAVTETTGLSPSVSNDSGDWETVPVRARASAATSSPSSIKDTGSLLSDGQVPGLVRTKKQRQNGARAKDRAEAKAMEEEDRLRRLNRHKKDLEKAKIAHAYQGKLGGKFGNSSMRASMNEEGKLIWD